MTVKRAQGRLRCGSAAVTAWVACAMALGAAAQTLPLRDPMQPPAAARGERALAAGGSPGATQHPAPDLVPPRHLITVGGKRFVVDNGRRFGVGELLGGARIEAIDDSWVTVREAGVRRRLPLYGSATRPESNPNPRPARKGDLP